MDPKKDNVFKDKHDHIASEIDKQLNAKPIELERIEENLKFIDEIKKDPLKDNINVMAYGFKPVNVNAILKNNIFNRSIFTVDKLCKMFLKMTLENKKKYLRKKRGLQFDYWWLLLLIIGVPVALVFIFMFLPRFMGG